MSPLQHSETIQSMLTGIPAIGLTFLMTLVALVFTLPFFRQVLSYAELEKHLNNTYRYKRRRLFIYLLPLQAAFSNGILHPKLY
jgi:hypothetical protein